MLRRAAAARARARPPRASVHDLTAPTLPRPLAPQMGEWIRANTPPKAVFAHRDFHIMPSSALAGRPSLVGYTGWMWSHGYPYHDRDRDRKLMIDGALKDSDNEAYQAMRRWGVRYILGDGLAEHHSPRKQRWQEAKAAGQPLPEYDPDAYLDGSLKRVHRVGRMDLLEVQGYGGPPT